MDLSRSSSGRIHSAVKESQFEVEIYRQITTLCPSFFARTFSISLNDETDRFHYEFEALEPMLNPCNKYNYELSRQLFSFDDECSRIREGIRFALDTLVGLHILHKSLHAIHCHLSPNNILYSQLDRCFKLNDFDLAMGVEDAKTVARTVGTRGFIAPEVQSKGLLSEAADVYSLGRIFELLIEPYMYKALLRSVPANLCQAYRSFSVLTAKMAASSAAVRPTVEDAIKVVLESFKSLNPQKMTNQFIRAAEEIVFKATEKSKSAARQSEVLIDPENRPPLVQPQSNLVTPKSRFSPNQRRNQLTL
jgi:hypothetical protein